MAELNVKEGDLVILSNYWSGKSIQTVQKITPTGCIRVNGLLFTKEGYQKGGDSWHRSSITKGTDVEIEKIKQQQFAASVLKRCKNLKSITHEDATLLNEILKRYNL